MLIALSTFIAAAVLIVLLPGPDTLVVLRNLVFGGRRLAARAALGVLAGLVVWVIAAALGLAALLHASEDAYLVLRIVGACYLGWLGIQALRARSSQADALDAVGADGGEDGASAVGRTRRRRRGLLGTGFTSGLATDLLNPKVGVFFVSFLPGFIPDGAPVGPMSLLLGAVFIVLTAAYYAALLALSGPVSRWLADGPVRRWVDRVTGVVLIGFGARIATES
ncbi:MAG: LysE family translocator [Frankia sp.]|nr:LysE family translocator [Frankia sp.]